MYEMKKKDGTGMRKTTLTDAKKLGLLPSVTGICGLLDKPALNEWKTEQACLAVLTAPRLKDENGVEEQTDAFVKRVLHTEAQQDQEAKLAADKGTLIHDALQAYFKGEPVSGDILPFIDPAFQHVWAQGEYVTSELIVVGNGYAGMADLLQDGGDFWALRDWKSTKKLPEKGPWPEHRLQLSAYAKAYQERLILAGEPLKPIRVFNVYLSTIEPGKFVEYEHEDWESTYIYGFAPLVLHWQWANNHAPKQPERDALIQQIVEEEPPVEVAQTQTEPPATAIPAQAVVPHKSGKNVVWTPGVRVQ